MDRERFRSFSSADRGNYLSRPVRAALPPEPVSPIEAPQSSKRSRLVIDVVVPLRRVLPKRERLRDLLLVPRSSRQHFVAVNLAFLILVGLFVQILDPITASRAYALSPQATKLIGESRDDTGQYLALNKDKTAYTFEVPDASEGAGAHGGRNASAYSTRLSLDASKGITYTDTKSKVSITVTPKFGTARGEKVNGNSIVFPSGVDKLVYSHKYNGLKEDIIVPAFRKDNLKYSFKLSLPIGAEARLDKQGNIGIYSGDTALYGDIQFGSDTDKTTIDKAREKSAKTNLVATIPYPIVKDATGKEYGDRATFNLSSKTVTEAEKMPKDVPAEVAQQLASQSRANTYELSITTKNIKNLKYPISVDPTIQATGASDFFKGTLEGNTEVDNTNNLVRRAPLTGGSIGSWVTDTNDAPQGATSNQIVYGKYIYQFGANAYYAPLNDSPVSGSMVGAWTMTNKPASNPPGAVFGYNGYMYSIFGGAVKRAAYAKINSNGSVGTWTTSANAFSTEADVLYAGVAYNGYIYVIGGEHTQDNAFPTPDEQVADTEVSYAKLNGDGSTGAWAATSSLNFPRRYGNATAYNGYMYLHNGGDWTDTTTARRIEYAPINSNGTLGAWTVSPNLSSSGHGGSAGRVYNGYLYMWGFWDNGALTEYAPINADGTVGTFTQTSLFTNGRGGLHGGAIYNGYLFVVGGYTGSSTNISYSDIQYAKIDPAGVSAPARTEATSFTTARATHGTTVINGYIYVIGGCTVIRSNCDSNAETLDSVYFAQINATTGVIGTWSATTGLPNARGKLAVTTMNNYIYVIGGNGNCGGLGAYNNQCDSVYYAAPTSTGTISSWSTGTSLSNARALGAAVAFNNRIYYLGGRTSIGAITDTAFVSTVNPSNGSNGSWTAVTALLNPTELLAATAYGGYIYTQGGYTGSVNVDGFLAQIFSDGTIGAWEATVAAATKRDGANLVAYNGHIYFIGGFNSPTIQLTVEYAPINATGRLGPYVQSPNGILAGSHHAGVASYGGRIYLTGGANTSNAVVATSDSFPINNGGSGSAGTFNTTSSVTNGRYYFGSVAYNGYLYVAGGAAAAGLANPLSSVEYAAINPNGSLGAWQSATSLPAGRYGLQLEAANGYLYVLGGDNGSGTLNTSVYAQVTSTGSLTGGWQSTTNLPAATKQFASGINNDKLYIMGGTNGTSSYSTVYYALPLSTGGLSSDAGCGSTWCSTTGFATARNGHAGFQYGGRLYIIGGTNGSALDDVQFATIAADGSVGSWTKTTSYPVAREYVSAAAKNGYVYIADTDPSTSISMHRAPILSSGAIGTWEQTPNTPRQVASRLIAGNSALYAISGFTASTTVRYALLQVTPRSGIYSRLLDFDRGVLPTKLITRGTGIGGGELDLTYLTGNNTSTSLDNSVTGLGVGYGANNFYAMSVGAGRSLSRYLVLRYTLDDTNGATFPDINGGQSTITDYDLYFTAGPGGRLRGGQTFVSGEDRGLQATR